MLLDQQFGELPASAAFSKESACGIGRYRTMHCQTKALNVEWNAVESDADVAII